MLTCRTCRTHLHVYKRSLNEDDFKGVRMLVNPHQRCGYSDSPFARIYFFHTSGSRNGLERNELLCPPRLTLRKTFFVIEKCFEDARQDEKHVPDLLESIIQPPGPVRPNIKKNDGFSTHGPYCSPTSSGASFLECSLCSEP